MPTEPQSTDAAGRPNKRLHALTNFTASRHLTPEKAGSVESKDSSHSCATSVTATTPTYSEEEHAKLDLELYKDYNRFKDHIISTFKQLTYLACRDNKLVSSNKSKVHKQCELLETQLKNWYDINFENLVRAKNHTYNTLTQFFQEQPNSGKRPPILKDVTKILTDSTGCPKALFSTALQNIACNKELQVLFNNLIEIYLNALAYLIYTPIERCDLHGDLAHYVKDQGKTGESFEADSLFSQVLPKSLFEQIKKKQLKKTEENTQKIDYLINQTIDFMKLNQRYNAAILDRASAKNKNKILKKQVDETEEKSAQLEQAKANAEARAASLTEQLAESKQAKASTEAQNEALSDQVQQLHAALEKARKEAEKSEQLLTESQSALATSNERLHVLTEEVRQQTERALAAKQRNQDLTETCEDQRTQIERLSSKCDTLNSRLSDTRTALERHEQKAQSQVSQLNQQINTLESRLEQSQLSDSAKADELKQLREELDNATQQHHADHEKLQQQLQEQVSKIISLRQASAQAQTTQQELAERSCTIETLQAELVRIRSTQEQTSTHNNELAQKQVQLEEKLAEAQQANSRLQQELETNQETARTLQSSLANAQSEALASREKLSALQSKHTEFTRAFAAQIAERQHQLENQARRRKFEATKQHSFGESKGSDNQSAQATTFELPDLRQITNYNNNCVLAWPEPKTITKHLQNEWKIKLFNALKDYISARRKNTNQYHGFMITGHGCGMSRTTKLSAAYKLMKIISGIAPTNTLTAQEIAALTTKGWSSNGLRDHVKSALWGAPGNPSVNTSVQTVNSAITWIINNFSTDHPSTAPIQVQAS